VGEPCKLYSALQSQMIWFPALLLGLYCFLEAETIVSAALELTVWPGTLHPPGSIFQVLGLQS
jgi:hypothetical protein